MSVEGFEEIAIPGFGGLVTNVDRAQLPLGLSPFCHDVEFRGMAVQSRRGSTNQWDTTVGSGVQYLADYTKPDGTKRLLAMLADGSLYKTVSGSISSVTTNLGASVRAKGANLFGRHYFCRGDGKLGSGQPVSFDDTSVVRVAPDGPARAPFVGAGAALASAVPIATWYARVAFLFANGYLSPLGPANSGYSADGTHKIAISSVVIGPSNVIARVIFLSEEPDSGYYTLNTASCALLIGDNTTTSVADISFDEETLRSGQSGDELLRQIVLPPQMGCVAYNRRMFFWGGRNALTQLNVRGTDRVPYLGPGLQTYNFHLDGGFDGTIPSNWFATGSDTGGEGSATPAGSTGQVYEITGNGTTPRGNIYCSTSPEYVLELGRLYSVRIRARKGSAHNTGTLKFQLTGGGGFATIAASIQASTLSTDWATYEVALVTSALTSYPSSFQFEWLVDSSGGSALGNTNTIQIDWVELFETSDATSTSIVFGSRRDFPDAIDGRDGFLVADENNGQDIRSCFVLRGSLYMAKERSLFVATDNNVSEPIGWTTEQISNVIGTPSPHGVAVGDGFAVILSRSGAYLFDGGVPVKISQEIQPDWDSFNWTYGHKFWTAIDSELKQVYFGVCSTAATTPNLVYVVNYENGFGAPEPFGGGRRWTVWTLTTNGMVIAEDYSSFAAKTYFGITTAGRIDAIDATIGGGPINAVAVYQTGLIPHASPTRSLIGKLQIRVIGATGGTNATRFKVYWADGSFGSFVNHITPASGNDMDLTTEPTYDREYSLRIPTLGASFQFSQAAGYFQLLRLGVWVKRTAPFGPVRGII